MAQGSAQSPETQGGAGSFGSGGKLKVDLGTFTHNLVRLWISKLHHSYAHFSKSSKSLSPSKGYSYILAKVLMSRQNHFDTRTIPAPF